MTRDNSPRNRKLKLWKARSVRFRFLATVIFYMLAITIFIGGISIYEVDKYIQEQAENYIKVSCVNEGEQINNSLENMEKSVKIMEGYLMDFFKSEEDVENRELQGQVIKSAEKMFIDVAKHTSTKGAVSYYFRLDPAISDNKSGLFYSKMKDGDEFLPLEPTDISLYEKEDVEHVGWFWQPYEAEKPVWMKPYYNQNNEILMISYVIPMYLGEKFIGVVGMDFDYVALSDQVHGIEVYEHGFAHLEIDGVIICGDVPESDSSHDSNSNKYLRESVELLNGMRLVLSANYDDIRQIRYEIEFKILLTVLILSALFTVIAVFVVKKITDPLKNLANVAERLADGDYEIEIEQSDAREIRLLSAAFENMAVRLREREELLRLSANRDSMTGLRNTTSYTAWVSQFDKEIENNGFDFGVVMLDLNNLKETNDTYGHEVGDELIKTSAGIISEVFKRSPVFRIGGDEFLVVLQNKDFENREELFELLDSRCRSTFVSENAQIPIGIAMGFARFEPGRDLRFADVFKRADNAMYENKRNAKS